MTSEIKAKLHSGFLHPLALAILLLTAPVLEAWRLTATSSVDVWWHLRTGLWILQQHAFPKTGLFSQYAGLPWHDSSWAYDLVLAITFKVWGLRAIVILLMACELGFAWVTYRLAHAAKAGFWSAVVLSAVAQYVVPSFQPAPSAISTLFFGLELLLLVESRRSGSTRRLLWLPPLFLLWANLDVRVVMGLCLLAIFLVGLACEGGMRRISANVLSDRILPVPIKSVAALAGISLACSIGNPYSYHVFSDFVRSLYNDTSFHYVAEMHAMSFRHAREYILMLLVLAAFLALGRRRSLEAFELMALTAGTLLAFRVQRDAWVAVLPAIVAIGSGLAGARTVEDGKQAVLRGWQRYATPALVTSIFIVSILRMPDSRGLMEKIGQNFPVQACDYIRTSRPPKPIFNSYSWGGFLTWYLTDYPVSIDSRMDLYGDEILARYFQSTSGKERLDADPGFTTAQTLLLETQSGMVKALIEIPELSSQYRLVYRDHLATVFVRQ